MFKFILIAVTIAVVNAGNLGLHSPQYSDATAVSSVYNSITNNAAHQQQQHESYIAAKSPATFTVQQHSLPAVQLHSSGAVHQSAGLSNYAVQSAPVLKLHHSVPQAVIRSHSSPVVQIHSAPAVKLHSAAVKLHSAPAVQIHSAPVIKLHSQPAIAAVHSAPSVSVLRVPNPTINLHHSTQQLGNGVHYEHEVPVAYAAKEIRYSLAPEVSHVSFDGYGTHYAW